MNKSREKYFGHEYDKYQSKNPIVKRIMNGYLNAVNRHISSLETKNILDIGCGEGELTAHIKAMKPNDDIIAIDLSDEVLKNNIPGVTFRKMSVYELEYEDSTFDLITCFETLEHLDDVEHISSIDQ